MAEKCSKSLDSTSDSTAQRSADAVFSYIRPRDAGVAALRITPEFGDPVCSSRRAFFIHHTNNSQLQEKTKVTLGMDLLRVLLLDLDEKADDVTGPPGRTVVVGPK